MKTTTVRTLTIEDFNPNGHFSKASYASLLRLKGCWLKEAGFPAGTKVTVKNIGPGVIELRISSPPSPVEVAFVNAINQLNAVLNENPPPPGTAGSL